MIKVKKPLDRTNYNLGYKIVEVTPELADSQLSKVDGERNTQWRGVELATQADIDKWGVKGETLEAQGALKVGDGTKATDEILKELSEVKQLSEMAMDENEKLS